jgi:hypothetical protein
VSELFVRMPSYFRRIDYTAALNRACGFLATDRGFAHKTLIAQQFLRLPKKQA